MIQTSPSGAYAVSAAASSIGAFISAANRAPMLSEAEEFALARRFFRDQNDLEAAHKLVTSHLRLVIAIASGYLGYGLPHADLIQEGNIGLMKAVKRFDPDRGVRLVSLAIRWIRAEICEYVVKNWRMVIIASTKAQRKLFFNLRTMKSGLAQDANSAQKFGTLGAEEVGAIACKLGVKPAEVVEMETRLSGGDALLERDSDEEDEHPQPIAYLAADSSMQPLAILERKENERMLDVVLHEALADLDLRSRSIVQRRWLGGDGKDAPTLHELAREFGVSAERIRQIEAKAMQQMKAVLTTPRTAAQVFDVGSCRRAVKRERSCRTATGGTGRRHVGAAYHRTPAPVLLTAMTP